MDENKMYRNHNLIFSDFQVSIEFMVNSLIQAY